MKKKKRKKQQQQPTIIFNPSLNIPSYSYGNRQPVNPSMLPEMPEFNLNNIFQRTPQAEAQPITQATTQTIMQKIKEQIEP